MEGGNVFKARKVRGIANGAGRAKGLAPKSFFPDLAKTRPAATNRRGILRYYLGDPGLGGFRGIRQSNDEGGATVGFAIHGQRTVMPLNDRLRDTEP